MYVEPRKKWYILTSLLGRSWDTDVEKKLMGTKGGKPQGVGWWCAELGNWDWHVYPDVYKIDD